MNRPPLPPNSDREMFWMRDGVAYMHGGQFEVRVDELTGDERYFASCIARCMWLDEAEHWAKTPVNDCKHFDDIAHWKSEAVANAEQWRKWGASG